LLDVTLVPETTVQSIPDVTLSPLVDQEVPTDSHPTSFGFSLNPPSDLALVGALVEASPNPLGFRMRSPWDRLTDVSTYGPSGSEEDDEPSICWDFSGLGNPSAMRDFMTACDYCLSDCSDGSRSLGDEDCDPSRECFHVDLGGPSEGNHLGMPEDGDLPRPVPRVDIQRELAVVPVQAGGHCDGTSQVIRPTYSCPCPTDIRHPVEVPKSLDKFGIIPYLTRNVSPVLQTLQNIGDKEMRKRIT
jgi:hypothetical protein